MNKRRDAAPDAPSLFAEVTRIRERESQPRSSRVNAVWLDSYKLTPLTTPDRANSSGPLSIRNLSTPKTKRVASTACTIRLRYTSFVLKANSYRRAILAASNNPPSRQGYWIATPPDKYFRPTTIPYAEIPPHPVTKLWHRPRPVERGLQFSFLTRSLLVTAHNAIRREADSQVSDPCYLDLGPISGATAPLNTCSMKTRSDSIGGGYAYAL